MILRCKEIALVVLKSFCDAVVLCSGIVATCNVVLKLFYVMLKEFYNNIKPLVEDALEWDKGVVRYYKTNLFALFFTELKIICKILNPKYWGVKRMLKFLAKTIIENILTKFWENEKLPFKFYLEEEFFYFPYSFEE